MLKNFKKIIATVAALAIASSSFVAMAATYPDVTPDASYYSAVEQLSALGMIAGFDDGTFKADEKVTRAQMAKLVVGAKNLLAAAEANTTQKFTDVPATHWAVGYVAEGVAQQIINGTSDTTFDPEATVTFAQAMKMLVNACGYEPYAQNAGGWPNGYLSWGTELGINKGVTGVGNDTELTRGQVAQMIANAIKAPILDIVDYETDNGKLVPKYEQKDGTGKGYQTLLTSEWDVYEVYGRVKGTQRNSGEVGKVEYTVEKADNFDGVKYTGKDVTPDGADETVYDVEEITAASNNSGAEDLYLEYTYALISKNDDDEYAIVYIESAGKNQYVAFNKNLVVPVEAPSSSAVTELNLFKSETSNDSKTYELDADVKLIVNGVQINEEALTQEALFEFLNAPFENAYLINSPKNGAASTDKKYDYITLDAYETIVVEEIVTKANGKTRIIADAVNIDVDPENEDKSYSFVLTDGTELEVTDLQPNDVLSVQAEPGDLEGSDFYNVIVSRDTAEGKVTASGKDAAGDVVYTVGDAQYKFNADYESEELGLTKTYTLYLDKDGNITKYEILAESVNYAIVDRFYTPSGDDKKVRLVLKDGSKVDYVLDDNDSNLDDDVNLSGVGFVNGDDTLATYALDRFVEYTVNKAGEVTLKALDESKIKEVEGGTYNARTSRIGDYGVADTTIILNAATFAKDTKKAVSVTDKEKLIEDMEYTVVFLGEQNKADGTYPMVVLLSDANGFTVNSQLQVAAGGVKTLTDDGQQVTAIPVYAEDGTVTDLILADKVYDRATATEDSGATVFDEFDTDAIEEGVPFVAATNSAGEVTDIWVIATDTQLVDASTFIDGAGTIAMPDQDAVAADNQAIDFKGVAAGKTVEFVMAPVVKKYSAGISLATTMGTTLVDENDPETPGDDTDDTEYTTSTDAGTFFSYAATAKAYTFDENLKEGRRVALADSVAEVTQSQISRNGKIGNLINWDSDLNTPAFAIARVYGGDIQEIYSIVLAD